MEMSRWPRVSEELLKRSVVDSANYAEENMQNALVFFDERKEKMILFALQEMERNGYIAEFGVWEGNTVNLIARNLTDKTIYGFDSFNGLPENWSGWDGAKGRFDLKGILPEVLPNVELVKGLFDESLPKWLETHKDFFSLLIIDSDLYSSANTILNNIGTDQIKDGTLILFDEYFGYINWRNHEFKAWQEFVKNHNIEYDYLAINHMQALVRVRKVNK
jgi:hypothetical protein